MTRNRRRAILRVGGENAVLAARSAHIPGLFRTELSAILTKIRQRAIRPYARRAVVNSDECYAATTALSQVEHMPFTRPVSNPEACGALQRHLFWFFASTRYLLAIFAGLFRVCLTILPHTATQRLNLVLEPAAGDWTQQVASSGRTSEAGIGPKTAAGIDAGGF